MPVQIGAKSHAFTEPLGLLSDCHRRIQMFIGSLRGLAKLNGHSLSDEGRLALENALRYFREAAPKHTVDEEQSLFPRLKALHPDESALVFADMEVLEGEHQWAEALHAEVDRLGQKYITAGTLSEADASAFQNAVEALFAMYERHIKLEDESLFVFAAKVLSDSDKFAIAQEMAARRKSDR
jgi:hemerythrin-like domain-containing protein